MKILGIETSCDETAMSVVEVKSENLKVRSGEEIGVLSNVISSQVKLHAKYGGVVPSLAAREHVKNIKHVFNLAIRKAKIKKFDKEIDFIAVTHGPGLGPALLVGLTFAKTISWLYKKPVVGVNHLEGHIYSNWLPPMANPESETLNLKQIQNSKLKTQNKNFFPTLNLIVSGGHTELVLMENHGQYKIIGETLDDAVGEAFDKVARLLGLGYPGGPAIAKHASQWNIEISPALDKLWAKAGNIEILFPRPMEKSKNYNFSYAGLKTSVLYKVKDLKNTGVKLTDHVINQICYEFQNAALDVLVLKTVKAAQRYKVKSIFLSGGVSANKELRSRLATEAKKIGIKYSQPELEYTGDNATMIAVAGYFSYAKTKKIKTAYNAAEMKANLRF